MKTVKFIVVASLMLTLAGCENSNQINTSTDVQKETKEDSVINSDQNKNNGNKANIESKVTTNKTNNNTKSKDEVVKDVKKENSQVKKTIVIDPGHSSIGNMEQEPISPDSTKTKAKDVLGATGNYTGVPENQTTVAISTLLKDKLEKMGYNVILTKDEVSKSLSNIDRAKIGNENNADLVIRIHADSANSSRARGASALVPAANEYTKGIHDISKRYGSTIINTYTNELNLHSRGVIERYDMTGFNWSKVPVIILEMGFLSNENEDKFISNPQNHDKIAMAIANGVNNCFNK